MRARSAAHIRNALPNLLPPFPAESVEELAAMADQTVRVANLPDSGSAQRIAMELTRMIANNESKVTAENARQYYLDLYAACRKVVF